MKKPFAIALSFLLVFGIVTGVFYWAGLSTKAPSLTQLRNFAFLMDSFNLADYLEDKAQDLQLMRRVLSDWLGNVLDVTHPNYIVSTPISEVWIVDESLDDGGYTLYTQYVKFYNGDTREEEFRYKIQSTDKKEVVNEHSFTTMIYAMTMTNHEIDDGESNLGIKSLLRAILNLFTFAFQALVMFAFVLSHVVPFVLGGAFDLVKWVLRMLLFVLTGNAPVW